VNAITLVDDDVTATSQMIEFASRTHQTAAHELARDYRPAWMQPAAMPVRVETWRMDGRIVHRVVGILWGNTTTTRGLEIRFGDGDWESVAVCEERTDTRTWTLWEHPWVPESAGTYVIVLRFRGGSVESVRLDRGYYLREVRIEAD
jgi:hypothetical protein